MIKRIERPTWESGSHDLDNWFTNNVEPINKAIDEGVVVCKGRNFSGWTEEPDTEFDTHKALIICREPIKRESAEDVLRDLLKKSEDVYLISSWAGPILERAKKVLE